MGISNGLGYLVCPVQKGREEKFQAERLTEATTQRHG